jgi:glycosyltransferase involved in cell wall biosynthesis
MDSCKVSVCIPTYNYAAFLPEAIESILGQRFTDFELIIIDDNSTDDTRSIGQHYARRDPRVRFSVNPENLGMVQNWNLCLEQARGEYVKFVFGDDLLASPDALGLMVQQLEGAPSVSLVCSARAIIDERSKLMRIESYIKKTGVLPGADVINSCLLRKKNLVGEPSVVMFRRSQAARGFLVNYRQIVDLEMWFHLLEQGDLACLEEPLCSFRVHGRQQTQVNEENVSDLFDFCYLAQDYLDKEYVTLSGFMKGFVRYDGFFRIWKLHKRGKLSREAAQQLIDTHYGLARFRRWLPWYKVFKPCLKLYLKITV